MGSPFGSFGRTKEHRSSENASPPPRGRGGAHERPDRTTNERDSQQEERQQDKKGERREEDKGTKWAAPSGSSNTPNCAKYRFSGDSEQFVVPILGELRYNLYLAAVRRFPYFVRRGSQFGECGRGRGPFQRQDPQGERGRDVRSTSEQGAPRKVGGDLRPNPPKRALHAQGLLSLT